MIELNIPGRGLIHSLADVAQGLAQEPQVRPVQPIFPYNQVPKTVGGRCPTYFPISLRPLGRPMALAHLFHSRDETTIAPQVAQTIEVAWFR